MSDWTVVVAGPADSDLAVQLAAQGGLNVLASPDIYDLPPGHLVGSAINEFPGPVAVAAPYAPRAIYWTIRAVGAEGKRADWPETKTDGKIIHPIDITDCSTAEAVERIVAVTGPADGKGMVRDFYDALPKRWYPVIDYDRCMNCLECVEFCLFGVYELDGAARVHVAIGDNCKTGCPACSRVCPTGAIIFPRYVDGGPIAGADAPMPGNLTGQEARSAAMDHVKAYAEKFGDIDNGVMGPKLDKTIDDLEAFEP